MSFGGWVIKRNDRIRICSLMCTLSSPGPIRWRPGHPSRAFCQLINYCSRPNLLPFISTKTQSNNKHALFYLRRLLTIRIHYFSLFANELLSCHHSTLSIHRLFYSTTQLIQISICLMINIDFKNCDSFCRECVKQRMCFYWSILFFVWGYTCYIYKVVALVG